MRGLHANADRVNEPEPAPHSQAGYPCGVLVTTSSSGGVSLSLEGRARLLRALSLMIEKNPSKQMRYASIPVALTYIEHQLAQGKAILHDGFLILYDIGRPWYCTTDMLIEELTLKIGPSEHGPAGAIRLLESIAREAGVPAMVVGDAQTGRMVPHYTAAGFEPLGVQLWKETDHGVYQEAHRG